MLHIMLRAGIKGTKGICNKTITIQMYIEVQIGLKADVTHDAESWNQGNQRYLKQKYHHKNVYRGANRPY